MLTEILTAALVEPIKLWIAQRHARRRVWKPLFREFAANYEIVERLLRGKIVPGSLAPAYICETKLHVECHREAQSHPLIFYSDEAANFFDEFYRFIQEAKELTDGEAIHYRVEGWYNRGRYELRHDKALKRGLKNYLSRREREALNLGSPPPSDPLHSSLRPYQ
jgi:hypothetical protein